MGLPRVRITLSNGALGALATTGDGIAGMVCNADAGTDAMPLGGPKQINNLQDAVALGITATDMPAQYRQIKEFYDGYQYITGSENAELWLMIVANTVTQTQMVTYSNTSGARKLVEASQGRIKLLATNRNPAGGFSPTLTNGMDIDATAALPPAQVFGTTFARLNRPLRVLIEGRHFLSAQASSMLDLKTLTNPRAGIVLAGTTNDRSASIGMALGVAAGLSVEKNIGRVRNGALPIAEGSGWIGDVQVENATAILDGLHDKGYIILRRHEGRTGYFFNDDPMAANPTSDDYAYLSSGRVIDKVQRLIYDRLVDLINEDVETEDGGRLPEPIIQTIQNDIELYVTRNAAGNIAGFKAFIDPAQNVVSTSKLVVKFRTRPRGYFRDIDGELGFALSL